MKATLFLVAAVASFSSAEFLDKNYYLKNIAPKVLQRIEDFRNEHANNFTSSQEMTLGLSENVIRTFNTAEINQLADICGTAFSKEQCTSLFFPDKKAAGAQGHEKRADGCECDTGLDFCYMYAGYEDTTCHSGDHNGMCEYSSVGCGFAYAQYCNGYCA